jgi:tetratricopeptide (TPR) repeat protein
MTPVQSRILSTQGELNPRTASGPVGAVGRRGNRAPRLLERPPVTPEERLATFRKFLEKSPDDPFARYSLAMGHRAVGQPAEAVREFEELARRRPDYVATYLMWGQTLESMGRAEDAAGVYDRGMEAARGAQNAHALSELGQARDGLRRLRGL